MRKIFSRTLICTLIMLLSSLTVNAQVEEFEKYSDMKNVTYVYISKAMLTLAKGLTTPSVPGMDMKNAFGKLNAIQIITTENKAARAKLKAEVADVVKRDKYEMLMQVDEDDSKVRIYFKDGKKQSVILMSTDESNETSVIAFSGTFKIEDVQKMAESSKF